MRSLTVFSAVSNALTKQAGLSPIDNRGGWWPWIREPYTGAWQRNDEWTTETVLAFHAVYACITLIAADIGKLRIKLMQQDSDGIWEETESPAFSPVLRKPNRYQTHIQFKEYWLSSKLIRGNTYVLKQRDERRVVVALYILDPSRVTPLISPDGAIYYELSKDDLSNQEQSRVTVPASEIIHDRMNCIFHPLVGTSPIFACGLAASQGLHIQNNSTQFFSNNSRPGGILTAPGSISQDTADRLKTYWNDNYTGANSGKVAVLGDGLKFEAMRMSAVDSQLIEQLKWNAEVVCSTFHVPAYMVGVGSIPALGSVEALWQQYYSQCLQSHIESMEILLDEGLGLDVTVGGRTMGTELDLDGLLRMDKAAQIKTLADSISGSILTPDEARKAIDRKPLPGGNTIYMQQQNYSLGALAKRDAQENPFAPAAPPSPAPESEQDDPEEAVNEELRAMLETITKGLQEAAHA